jgi:hypothetical protein
MLLRYNHIRIHPTPIIKPYCTTPTILTMGNAQSQRQRPPFRPTSNGVYDGPLFGGHHAGDFSLAVCPLPCWPHLPVSLPVMTVNHTLAYVRELP